MHFIFNHQVWVRIITLTNVFNSEPELLTLSHTKLRKSLAHDVFLSVRQEQSTISGCGGGGEDGERLTPAVVPGHVGGGGGGGGGGERGGGVSSLAGGRPRDGQSALPSWSLATIWCDRDRECVNILESCA